MSSIYENVQRAAQVAREFDLEVGEVRVGQYHNVPEGVDLRLVGVLEPFLEPEDATADSYVFATGRLDLRLNGETVNSIVVRDDAPILSHLLIKQDARYWLDTRFDEVHSAGLANEEATLELAQLSAELGPHEAIEMLMSRALADLVESLF